MSTKNERLATLNEIKRHSTMHDEYYRQLLALIKPIITEIDKYSCFIKIRMRPKFYDQLIELNKLLESNLPDGGTYAICGCPVIVDESLEDKNFEIIK